MHLCNNQIFLPENNGILWVSIVGNGREEGMGYSLCTTSVLQTWKKEKHLLVH